jgi:hypothetical protein
MLPTNEELLHNLESQIRELDERLRPIAERPIAFADIPRLRELAAKHDPLSEAGIRREAHAALRLAIALYCRSSADERRELRGFFRKYDAFAWAATLPERPATEEGFRNHLLHFSLVDQGRDSRDAFLTLQYLCAEAKRAGIDVRPILNEVAALSSDENKYGMGSTRKQLIDAAER